MQILQDLASNKDQWELEFTSTSLAQYDFSAAFYLRSKIKQTTNTVEEKKITKRSSSLFWLCKGMLTDVRLKNTENGGRGNKTNSVSYNFQGKSMRQNK